MGTPSNRSAGTQSSQRGIIKGVSLVDSNTGLPVDVIRDTHGTRRLAVDANITVDDITVETRPLQASTDNVAIKDPVSGFILKINTDGSIDTNVQIDSAGGDSVLVVGTEDGTKTGIQHVLEVGSDGMLRVGDNNKLIPKIFDDIEVTAKNGNGDPVTIVYRSATISVASLTVLYDSDGDFQRVTRT